ncbi:MAG: alpha/beta hydrolase [Phyllobacteriaceae bacterium]|nr:alpha/beta hydrolase [Phyllobacteriaceae bacterium]
MTAIGLLLLLGGLAYHFAALKIFNALVPKDGATARVLEDVAYGPHARHRLDVYVPQGTGPFPVLVFVYGGSWDSGVKADYGFAGHAFVAQGFFTIIADYRLVPEVHYPGFVEDTASVIGWASAQAAKQGGDPDHLFVVGHSAGAYNAVQAVLLQGLERQVTAMVSLAGPMDFLPLDSPKSIAAFAQVPDLPATQPVNRDLLNMPPLLLLHGADDTTVRLRNSRNLHAVLQRHGRVSVLKEYPGVSHVGILLALAKPLRGRASTLADVLDFLQRYR